MHSLLMHVQRWHDTRADKWQWNVLGGLIEEEPFVLASCSIFARHPSELKVCVAGIPKNLRGGIASILFALPVIKHNYAWAGCMPAGKPQ